MERKTLNFKGENLYIKIAKYEQNGRLAIISETDDRYYLDITKNLPEMMVKSENIVAIDNECKAQGLELQLLKEGVIEEIIGQKKYNYGTYDIARINMEKLKEYDPKGFKKYSKIEKNYNSYKLYNKEQMIKIAKEEGFLFVETSNGDCYGIRKKDVADFIMRENDRCEYSVNIYMYVPNTNIQEPILSTCGFFLDRINQKFRGEIIGRLVELQTTNAKPRKIKVFDNDIFATITPEELGENEDRTVQFNKFFSQYYDFPKTMEKEEEDEMEAE